ncbi:MAG: hypothetical protein JXR37_15650 [Kiritimatiellae bacterium]|nr:hypothetical protein [Kiritimatiellia bacterium]
MSKGFGSFRRFGLSAAGAALACATHLAGAITSVRAVEYYASPDGTGDGRSAGNPFKVESFWAVAKPGDTLWLKDGTYTGEDSMIVPPKGLSGEPGRPIAVKALHDGKVLIDGAHERQPVYLNGTEWFVLEGFNACRAGRPGDLSASVITLTGDAPGKGANHTVIRRVIAWDAKDNYNNNVWGHNRSDHVLYEDVAGFGIGRKILQPFRSKHTTIRRAWGRWEGFHAVGPKMTFGLYYHSFNTTIENCIGTWSGEQQKETYRLFCAKRSHPRNGQLMTKYAMDQPYGVFVSGALDKSDPSLFTQSKMLGCIGYIRGGDRFPTKNIFTVGAEGGIELRDCVAYIEPGTQRHAVGFGSCHPRNPEISGREAHNLTAIGGAEIAWRQPVSVSNVEHGATASDVTSIFNSPKGAQVAYRYVDGKLTSEPLWPWPMDQRIKAALALAGRRSVTHGMARDDGLVTSAIEQMFGSIPAEMKNEE